MYIENGIAFTDGSMEEAGFRGRTFHDETGEPFYLVPLPLLENDRPAAYGLAETARWVLPFGNNAARACVLYFATHDREKAEACWKALHSENKRAMRDTRCTIRSRDKRLIRCPDGYACEACPHPERIIFYNREQKTGNPGEGTDQPPLGKEDDGQELLRAEDRMVLKQLFDRMDRSSVLYATARVLHDHYGVAVKEIAKVFGCSESEVYRLLSRSREIGQQFRQEAEAAET